MPFFRSWVPSLTGRVSFRRLGEDAKGAKGRYYIDRNKSFLIGSAGENFSSDHWLKNKYTDFFFPRKTGYFHYTILAKSLCSKSHTENFVVDRNLSGWIFLQPARVPFWQRLFGFLKFEQQFLKSQSDFLELLDAAALDRVKNYQNADVIDIHREYKRWHGVLSENCDYKIPFRIKKSGEVSIKIDRNIINSARFSSNATFSVSDFRTQHNVALKCFNILRARFHEHKHHDRRSDTIIGVYECSKGDQSWRLRLVAQLLEKSRMFHNFDDAESQSKAQGIISYISSWLKINERREFMHHENVLKGRGFEIVNESDLSSLWASVSAKTNGIIARRGEMILVATTAIAFFAACAAVIAVKRDIANIIPDYVVYTSLGFIAACALSIAGMQLKRFIALFNFILLHPRNWFWAVTIVIVLISALLIRAVWIVFGS